MARSDHARYSSRTDKIDRAATRRPRKQTRRQTTRATIVAAAMQEV